MASSGYFGFRTFDNQRNPSSAIQKFIVGCENCHSHEVRFRLHCEDGEASLTLLCGRCGETFRLPSKLLDGG